MDPSGPLPLDIDSAVALLVVAAVAVAAAAAAVDCVEDEAGLIADDGDTNAWQPAWESSVWCKFEWNRPVVSVAGRFQLEGLVSTEGQTLLNASS